MAILGWVSIFWVMLVSSLMEPLRLENACERLSPRIYSLTSSSVPFGFSMILGVEDWEQSICSIVEPVAGFNGFGETN